MGSDAQTLDVRCISLRRGGRMLGCWLRGRDRPTRLANGVVLGYWGPDKGGYALALCLPCNYRVSE